jgi:major membrane immunogen (membrane-anchored lipoprotein)
MNITWYWGTDSSTPNMFGKNNSVTNGTYEMPNTNFTTNAVTYYWRVTINDGHGEWTNETYHFTTIAGNKIVVSKTSNAYSLEISPTGTTLYW